MELKITLGFSHVRDSISMIDRALAQYPDDDEAVSLQHLRDALMEALPAGHRSIVTGAQALTEKQANALEKLRDLQARGFPFRSKTGSIITGCNTTVLHNLSRAGLISVSQIWLRGRCSTDLTVK